MFAEMTKKYVEAAIGSETTEAINKYGEKYNSLHEGYAVLREEADEVRDEYINVKNGCYSMWESVRKNSVTKEEVEKIKTNAEQLALEAVQVAAVCNKILNGL